MLSVVWTKCIKFFFSFPPNTTIKEHWIEYICSKLKTAKVLNSMDNCGICCHRTWWWSLGLMTLKGDLVDIIWDDPGLSMFRGNILLNASSWWVTAGRSFNISSPVVEFPGHLENKLQETRCWTRWIIDLDPAGFLPTFSYLHFFQNCLSSKNMQKLVKTQIDHNRIKQYF